jgi:hypothetical protein
MTWPPTATVVDSSAKVDGLDRHRRLVELGGFAQLVEASMV